MKSKQKQEFLKIISEYQGILHKINLLYFHNKTDREDNFQEMLYQLWKSYPKLRNKKSIGSWIYAVAINTSISNLKKQQKPGNHDQFPEQAETANFSDNLEYDESIQQLLKAIKKLHETDRSIMLLYLEEKSYAEISEILGISASNVGVRISRAKKTLKQYLKQYNYGK